jgi:hypothetical protein
MRVPNVWRRSWERIRQIWEQIPYTRASFPAWPSWHSARLAVSRGSASPIGPRREQRVDHPPKPARMTGIMAGVAVDGQAVYTRQAHRKGQDPRRLLTVCWADEQGVEAAGAHESPDRIDVVAHEGDVFEADPGAVEEDDRRA